MRHRHAVFANALCDLVMRQTELLGQSTRAARLFDWIEIRALQVFDQTEHELLVVPGGGAYGGGDCRQPGEPGCPPPSLTGDELVAVGQLSHEQRLEDAVKPDGIRQLAQRLRFKTST